MQHEVYGNQFYKQFFKLLLLLMAFDFASRVFFDRYTNKNKNNNGSNGTNTNNTNSTNSINKNINNDNQDVENNFDNNSIENKIHIKYCSNCGFKKTFDTYKTELEANIPDILVEGSEMEPIGFNKTLKTLLTILQYSLVLLSLFGDKLFDKYNIQRPELYLKFKDKKYIVLMIIYFGFNYIQSGLSCTGAFEVFLNDNIIYSKLKTNSLPTLSFLKKMIEKNLSV